MWQKEKNQSSTVFVVVYLYRITVYLNQIETEKILFEYEEKKSEEYCIDYTLLERPNGIQYKFQKLFLSQIVHCKNRIEDKIYSFNTDFIQLAWCLLNFYQKDSCIRLK